MARYALVIGISEYLSPLLPPLPKTINDAEAVAKLLEQYGDFQSVQRLPQRWNSTKSGYEIGSERVKGAQLGEELQEFLLKRAKNNEALIYFSGHGFTISDNLGKQKGYLATSDCVLKVSGNQFIEQQYAISLDSLNELIRDAQLSNLVMLLDCCHSGYFLERQLIEHTLTSFTLPKDYYLIAACRGFESAGIIKTEEYSIFTKAVIQGLASENAGITGRISSDRLFDFISDQLKGSVQEPIRMSLGRAINLVRYRELEIPAQEEIKFNQENPYRGLYAFEAEQAKYFCGREQDVLKLLSLLAKSRFLAVIGYSGSGKSSLVKAGLLPQLTSDRIPGSSQWQSISFTPGDNPLHKLTEALTQQKQDKPQLLFIDQFEELFTLCKDEEKRQAFIRLIVQEVNATERQTRIIITIRGDFLKQCTDYLEIANLINSNPPTSYIVTPMTPTGLEEAIEKPAQLHGVAFEHGLVSQIADDVINRRGALPLLQYALKELWRVCIEEPESPEPILTHQGYAKIGGVIGALNNRARIVYQSLNDKDQAFARRLFMELVDLSTGEVTRRRADRERLAAIADSFEQFQWVTGLLAGSQQRLIITDENIIEVAHEALLTEWKLLNNWIDNNRENIRIQRSLEAECQEWIKRFKKSDEALLTGAKLAVISEWEQNNKPILPVNEREFLHKSLAKQEQQKQAEIEQERRLKELAEARANAEAEKAKEALNREKEALNREKVEKQRNFLLRTSVLGLAIVAILAIGLMQQSQQREKAIVEALIEKPQQRLQNKNQLEALIESVKVLKYLKKISGNKQGYVISLQNIIYKSQERNRLAGHQEKVNDVSVSPDDSMIASASDDQTVKLWTKEGQRIKTAKPLMHNNNQVWTVTFSHNGQLLASGDGDGIIKIWNSKNGELIRLIEQNEVNPDMRTVLKLRFSPNDNIVAAANFDGTIKLWTVNDRQKSPKIISHGDIVQGISFNKEGTAIASVGQDGNIKIWNVQDGKLLQTLKHGSVIYDVSFSPNNLMIASAGEDRTIKIWRWNSSNNKYNPSPEKTLVGHNGWVNKISFSPNGENITSASEDKTVKLWTISNLQSETFWHSDSVNSVTFSLKEPVIVSADGKIVRVWSTISKKLEKAQIQETFRYTCDLLHNYLTTNSHLTQEDKQVCNDL